MKKEWVDAFGRMTYGIYVLTTAFENRVNGMIASWVSQVSYEPPLIAVAVHTNRSCHLLIEGSGHFALHVLGKSQKQQAYQFLSAEPEKKFDGIGWHTGIGGSPVLSNCLAFFECRLETRIRPGNHTVFIGEVIDSRVVSAADPLSTLDFHGQYIGKV
jgi:flavin reductase (DIM6/NTAB) family NADH-FMN oxidoreductase RutF